MYSDLSSNVKASNILNRKGKTDIGLEILGVFRVWVFFLSKTTNDAGQNLGQRSSIIPLIIFINIKIGRTCRILQYFFTLRRQPEWDANQCSYLMNNANECSAYSKSVCRILSASPHISCGFKHPVSQEIIERDCKVMTEIWSPKSA